MSTTLFRFRQDLRLVDNAWWIHAFESAQTVIPVFVLDTNILDHMMHPDPRFKFVIDALIDLQQQLCHYGHTLIVKYGSAQEIIPQLLTQYKCDTLVYNRSYGIWSITRDVHITTRCKSQAITHHVVDDYLLIEPRQIDPRKVFGPFYKLWQQVPKKSVSDYNNFYCLHPHQIAPDHNRWKIEQILGIDTKDGIWRDIHWRRDRFTRDYADYTHTRNQLDHDGTSKLSVYLRFGIISIRQVYRHYARLDDLGAQTLISELAWRDFWHHIMYHFPYTRMAAFQMSKRSIARQNNLTWLQAWKEAKTGYPIIDAAMTQLRQHYRIPNRARMIVASFLTKDLLIDWTYGEQHFAHYLLDYDSCVNIWNRQRSASVGADPKPLRIFSPILQARRFDPQGNYIRLHLPQLSDVPTVMLHDPLKYKLPYYPPIVDHHQMSRQAKSMYATSKLIRL